MPQFYPDRRAFLRYSAAGLAGLALRPCLSFGQAEPGRRKPNIVLILIDDMGYADLGCQGSRDLLTPHIDSVAANGIRFTDGYVSAPVCSPSRAGLITGRYQNRFGHEYNPGGSPPRSFGLPLTEKTMADHLKAAGYATGLVGKWHLGSGDKAPRRRGFDEFFGFLAGGHSYIDARKNQPNPILRNEEPVDEREYLTDAFGREAVSFIDRHKSEPFFLYFSPNAIHGPMEPPAEMPEWAAKIGATRRRSMAGMLAALDDNVGRILKKLRDEGLEEDTLIFVLSDNGGPTSGNASKNTPFSGFKGDVREGGIRIPFMVQWKGKLPAGRAYERPVIALDILPTALAAAEARAVGDVQFDGVDLLPHLTGRMDGAPHQALFWRFGGDEQAVRMGDWKLTPQPDGKLVNLRDDPAEKINLADKHPEKVKELRDAFERWNAQNVEPLWPDGKPRKRR